MERDVEIGVARLTLIGLDNVIRLYRTRRDQIKYNGRSQADVDEICNYYNNDIRDIQDIRTGFLATLNLTATTRRIAFLDTTVREDVFEELRKVGLKDDLEATGEVKFL